LAVGRAEVWGTKSKEKRTGGAVTKERVKVQKKRKVVKAAIGRKKCEKWRDKKNYGIENKNRKAKVA